MKTIKQIAISMTEYEKKMSKIIAKKMSMENTMIALLDEASKYKLILPDEVERDDFKGSIVERISKAIKTKRNKK
jgi:hypothetical protein